MDPHLTAGDLLSLFQASPSPQSSRLTKPVQHVIMPSLPLADLGSNNIAEASMSTPAKKASIGQSSNESADHPDHIPDAAIPTPRRSGRKIGYRNTERLEIVSPLSKKQLGARKPKAVGQVDRDERSSGTQTLSTADMFLLTYQDLFLPLLPEKNYINQLAASMETRKSPNGAPSPTPQPQKQPDGIQGVMKQHQLDGLSFLAWLHVNGVPGILGDEMGLGKTLQTLSFLQYLKETRELGLGRPPHLIICPLSVLNTWVTEAKKFSPSLEVLQFHGRVKEREITKTKLKPRKDGSTLPYDCVVTSYETVEVERRWFSRSKWSYIILDEGTRIKNAETNLFKACKSLSSLNRLILTGTPVQNNLNELWALLHWLYPDVFTKNTSELFRNAFDLSKGSADRKVIDACRMLLGRIMLRRTKTSPVVDMYLPPKTEIQLFVPLSEMQRSWYQLLITRAGEKTVNDLFSNNRGKDQSTANEDLEVSDSFGSNLKTSDWRKLLNLLMQLRMLCVHPYLIPGVQPEPYTLGMHVVHASSKFVVLSKLLDELVVAQKRKVLIFSGFHGVLDLCEEMLHLKIDDGNDFRYLRFDGSTPRAGRNLVMRLFSEEPEYRVMLISTRAGGVGVNLQSASQIIFLDEDWNPTATLQAEARAHRFGQIEEVSVFKLCTTGTIEEQMLQRIHKKLYLSTRIIDATETPNDFSGGCGTEIDTNMSMTDLKNIIRRGAQTLMQNDSASGMLKWDMQTILDHCQKPISERQEDELTEEEWLSQAEKIECLLFEGVRLDRISVDACSESEVQELRREDRRKGKERTIMIDGYFVSKESAGCADWEAVPTMANKDPVGKTAMRQQIINQQHCHLCKESKNLIACAGCPRAYHTDCVKLDSKTTAFRTWYCPQHICNNCHKRAPEAGGLLYRCHICERAFCEDCVHWNATDQRKETLEEYESVGYGKREDAFYLRCQVCNNDELRPSTPVRRSSMDKGNPQSPAMSYSSMLSTVPTLFDGASPRSISSPKTPGRNPHAGIPSPLKRKLEDLTVG